MRNINVHFMVSEKEKELIDQRMAEVGIANMRAYLLKMALNGHIINIDMSSVRDFVFLLKNISNNINQIAKRANETRSICESDINELRREYAKVWDIINQLMKKFNEL